MTGNWQVTYCRKPGLGGGLAAAEASRRLEDCFGDTSCQLRAGPRPPFGLCSRYHLFQTGPHFDLDLALISESVLLAACESCQCRES